MASREAVVLLLQSETVVHPGAADVEAGIDLPVQRSPVTRWPVIHDSTFRGGLRRLVDDSGVHKSDDFFGVEEGDGDDKHPGRVVTPDVDLLLFPVASAKGIFAWVTSKEAVQAFVRRIQLFESMLGDDVRVLLNGTAENAGLEALASRLPASSNAVVGKKCALRWKNGQGERVVIEADDFKAEENGVVDELAKWIGSHALPSIGDFWTGRLEQHLAVLPADAFTHYVRTRTDIRTRIHVSDGRADNLWTEENLPVDCLFYTVLADMPPEKNREHAHGVKALVAAIRADARPALQLGGDQGLGRGWLRLRLLGGK